MARAPSIAVILVCSGCELRPVDAGTTSLQEAHDASTLEATVDSDDESLACVLPKIACGGRCIDTNQDPNHCGACNHSCSGDPPSCSTGRCDIEKIMHLACEGNVLASSRYFYVACQDQLVRVPRDQLGAIEYLDNPEAAVPEAGLAALKSGAPTYVFRRITSSGDLELRLRQWNEDKQTAEAIVTVTVPAPNGGDLVVAGTHVFAISTSSGWAAPSDIYLVTQSGQVAGPSAAHCVLLRWLSDGETMYWTELEGNTSTGSIHIFARFNPASLAREVIGYVEDSHSLAAVSDAYVYLRGPSDCVRFPKAGGPLQSAGTYCPEVFSPQFDFVFRNYKGPLVEKRLKGQLAPVLTRKLADWLQVWLVWAEDDEVIAKVPSAGVLPYYYRIGMLTPKP